MRRYKRILEIENVDERRGDRVDEPLALSWLDERTSIASCGDDALNIQAEKRA